MQWRGSDCKIKSRSVQRALLGLRLHEVTELIIILGRADILHRALVVPPGREKVVPPGCSLEFLLMCEVALALREQGSQVFSFQFCMSIMWFRCRISASWA